MPIPELTASEIAGFTNPQYLSWPGKYQVILAETADVSAVPPDLMTEGNYRLRLEGLVQQTSRMIDCKFSEGVICLPMPIVKYVLDANNRPLWVNPNLKAKVEESSAQV